MITGDRHRTPGDTMRRYGLCLLLVTALLGAACGALDDDAATDDGDFVLAYEEPHPDDADTAALIRDSRVADDLVEGLNGMLALPQDIHIVFTADDDGSGQHFDPEDNHIRMPWPSLTEDRAVLHDYGYDTAEDADAALLSMLEFVLYHEAGHALIENLDLPVTGREEDAVDVLAALMIVNTWEDGGDFVLSAADWFAAMAEQQDDEYSFAHYAGEHSLDEQRYVQLLCLVYGSDPDRYAELVSEDSLPTERAEGCPLEYERASSSWDTVLAPYMKS